MQAPNNNFHSADVEIYLESGDNRLQVSQVAQDLLMLREDVHESIFDGHEWELVIVVDGVAESCVIMPMNGGFERESRTLRFW